MDQPIDWNHYRTLVREAKETIDLEIVDNKSWTVWRGVERVAAASAVFADGRDPHQLPASDLEVFRQQVLGFRADLLIEDQPGRRLSRAYQDMLDRS